MKQGYHKFFRHIAGKVAIKNPEIPRGELGVGDAEILQDLPRIVPLKAKERIRVKKQSPTTIDKIVIAGNGPIFKEDLFPSIGYYGEGIK